MRWERVEVSEVVDTLVEVGFILAVKVERKREGRCVVRRGRQGVVGGAMEIWRARRKFPAGGEGCLVACRGRP